jgi:hypothetical protein
VSLSIALLGVMAQTECSFSAYFVAAASSLSVAFAYGCEDCDWLICPLLEPLSAIAAIDPIDYSLVSVSRPAFMDDT